MFFALLHLCLLLLLAFLDGVCPLSIVLNACELCVLLFLGWGRGGGGGGVVW